jgi:peroxiredoxin
VKLIEVGNDAPNFTVMDENEQNISLSDYRGKKVLLSWHPLAFTPICTDQMRSIENNWQKFQSLNTVPLGFSVDPTPAKKAWAIAIAIENLSLPSDFWPHGKVAKDYGIFDEKNGVSKRVNIIIDENGKVKWVKVYPSNEVPDINEVIQVISSM